MMTDTQIEILHLKDIAGVWEKFFLISARLNLKMRVGILYIITIPKL